MSILLRSVERLVATVALSSGEETVVINVESSAYPINLFSRLHDKSDVKTKNNKCPRTLPWGTPEMTGQPVFNNVFNNLYP